MRCLSCHYELKNLTEHRCPECGAAFHPDDPSTFATGPTHLGRFASVMVIIMVLTPVWVPLLVILIKNLI